MLLNGMRFRHRDEDIPVFRHYVGQSNAKVLPDLESVAGVPCHVVEIKGENGSIKIWTAHDKGFLPLKFERISTNPVRGDLFEQRVVQEIALVETDVGAFWYPKKARWILHERNGQESTNEINVSEFIPNAHMTQADFRVDFPPGTRIYDSIAGIQYRTGQIPDVDLQELRQTTALETDLNQAVGGANGALGLGTAETEIPAIAATADQNDQDSLMANGTVVAQASGAGFRRILCIALTGLGSVLLLMGIWSLRVSRRSLAQGGR